MSNILFAAMLGLSVRLLSFLPALSLAYLLRNGGKRMNGSLMSFTGGILIAFVCFEILPEAFSRASLIISFGGIFAGIFAVAAFEPYSEPLAERFYPNTGNRHIKTAILMSIGVCMHNIPEGMAIGSLTAISPASALKMAAILFLHCIPEAAAICLPLSKSETGIVKTARFIALLSLPMCIGSLFGFLAVNINTSFSSFFLSLAGGTMIYLCCGEILPESKGIWNGRMTPVSAGLGFICGIIVTKLI